MKAPTICCLLCSSFLIGCSSSSIDTEPVDTLCGAYRKENSQLVVLVPSAEKGTIRLYNVENGQSQRLYPVSGASKDTSQSKHPLRYQTGDGWSVKEPAVLHVEFRTFPGTEPRMRWEEEGCAPVDGQRIPIASEILEFENDGLKLTGRLYLPPGPGPHPAVVLHQGSERDSWMNFNSDGYLFAAHGVAAFCIDKRGVGVSQGHFTMNFLKLAADMAAAVGRIKTHKAIDPSRIGTGGFSQGGWIAPLAASLRQDVRFVVVGFGLADSPFDEDREETLNRLRDKGYGEADLNKARRVISAVQEVLRQDLRGGWKELGAVKKEYRNETWMKDLGDGMSAAFVKWPGWCLRMFGKKRMPPELAWDYDPRPTLEKIQVPMLWLIGAEDREAPPQETLARLDAFRRDGKPFEVVVFPGADHGITLFRVEKGQRVITGFHPDYWRTMARWVAKTAGVERQ